MNALQTYVAVRFARGARVIRFLQPAEGGAETRLLRGDRFLRSSRAAPVAASLGAEVRFILEGDRVLGLAVPGGGRAEKVR